MATIFSRIIRGEIPCHKIAEDERFLAFLDIRPLRPGHTLVIPKEESNYIFSMEDTALADLMVFAKKVARRIERAVPCERIGVIVCGIEVPHTHIHLVPIDAVRDLNFANAKEMPNEELAAIAERIRGVAEG